MGFYWIVRLIILLGNIIFLLTCTDEVCTIIGTFLSMYIRLTVILVLFYISIIIIIIFNLLYILVFSVFIFILVCYY